MCKYTSAITHVQLHTSATTHVQLHKSATTHVQLHTSATTHVLLHTSATTDEEQRVEEPPVRQQLGATGEKKLSNR